MEKITKVFSFVNSKGKAKICINGNIFVSPIQLTKATGLNSNFDLLVGSEIAAEFYVIGDDMSEGIKCTKDDTIVKEFSIVLSPQLQSYKLAAAFGVVMQAA